MLNKTTTEIEIIPETKITLKMKEERVDLQNNNFTLLLENEGLRKDKKNLEKEKEEVKNAVATLKKERKEIEEIMPNKRQELTDIQNEIGAQGIIKENQFLDTDRNVQTMKDQDTSIKNNDKVLEEKRKELKGIKSEIETNTSDNKTLKEKKDGMIKEIEGLELNKGKKEEEENKKLKLVIDAVELGNKSLESIKQSILENGQILNKVENEVDANKKKIISQELEMEENKKEMEKEKEKWAEEQKKKEEEWTTKMGLLTQAETRLDTKKEYMERAIELGKVNNLLKPDFK